MTLHDKVYYIERVEYLRRRVWSLCRRTVAKLLKTTVPKYEDLGNSQERAAWEGTQGIMEVLERLLVARRPGTGRTKLNLYDAVRNVEQ